MGGIAMKKYLVLLLSIILCIVSVNVYARSETGKRVDWYLEKIREVDNSFLQNVKAPTCNVFPIVAPWGAGELVCITEDEVSLGYAIFINGILNEFSLSPSPYTSIALSSDNMYYYDFANYSTISKAEADNLIRASKKHSQNIYRIPEGTRSYINTQKTLTNVYPQLQGSSKCLVAALSNVMWYWGSHGYSALTSGMTFESVKTSINTLFNGYYANSSVLSVASSYATSKCGHYFTGGANWSPTPETPCGEIYANYPCMVGFAPGSSYSTEAGHMTMCFGYVFTDQYLFLKLADGWSTSTVIKIWSIYNDCVIALHIQ